MAGLRGISANDPWGHETAVKLNAALTHLNGIAAAVTAEIGAAIATHDADAAAHSAAFAAFAATLIFPSIETGSVFDYIGSTAPAGYVFLDGKTIGNVSSGATGRANADTEALFTKLWDSMADAQAGVSTGRGASAAADFAANKTITLPDARGRVIAGQDDMGGTAASRLTSTTMSPDGATLGATGGAQTHTLTTPEMPAHTHDVDVRNTFAARTSTGANTAVTLTTVTTTSTGGSDAHNNVQPTLILNKIVKL
jgi:microcystin-dependent protein